jgi:hypothetical protein
MEEEEQQQKQIIQRELKFLEITVDHTPQVSGKEMTVMMDNTFGDLNYKLKFYPTTPYHVRKVMKNTVWLVNDDKDVEIITLRFNRGLYYLHYRGEIFGCIAGIPNIPFLVKLLTG